MWFNSPTWIWKILRIISSSFGMKITYIRKPVTNVLICYKHHLPRAHLTSIFWRATPAKQVLFQSKEESFGFLRWQLFAFQLETNQLRYLKTTSSRCNFGCLGNCMAEISVITSSERVTSTIDSGSAELQLKQHPKHKKLACDLWISGWWLQPNWKILVKVGIFPK